MSIDLPKFKSAARATLVAGALTAAMASMPTAVYAQPAIEFGFQSGGVTFGFGTGGFRIGVRCLDRDDIRRGLRRADFYDIDFISFTSRRAVVEATWEENDEDYRIHINRCDGEVTRIRRIS